MVHEPTFFILLDPQAEIHPHRKQQNRNEFAVFAFFALREGIGPGFGASGI
jgi:hypothetical protein